jgi:hypothetical protein
MLSPPLLFVLHALPIYNNYISQIYMCGLESYALGSY